VFRGRPLRRSSWVVVEVRHTFDALVGGGRLPELDEQRHSGVPVLSREVHRQQALPCHAGDVGPVQQQALHLRESEARGVDFEA